MPRTRLAKVSVRTAARVTTGAVHAPAVMRAQLPSAVRVLAGDAGVASIAIAYEASSVWTVQAAVCCGRSQVRSKLVYSCVKRVVAAAVRGACLVIAVIDCSTIFTHETRGAIARVACVVVHAGAVRRARLIIAVVNCATILSYKPSGAIARVTSESVHTSAVRGACLLVAVVNDCVCVCGRNFQRTLPCHQY